MEDFRDDKIDPVCAFCGEVTATEVEFKQGFVNAHPRCVAKAIEEAECKS